MTKETSPTNYNADVIVFEHLEKTGKIRGSKKQKLKMWRIQEVQSIVANKAHRLGIRVSRVCAWGNKTDLPMMVEVLLFVEKKPDSIPMNFASSRME